MKAKIKYEDYYQSQASLGYILSFKETSLGYIVRPYLQNSS